MMFKNLAILLFLQLRSSMKWVVGVSLFAFSTVAHAQASFIAYQVKGDAFYQSGNKKLPLKIGQSIIDNDNIITGPGSIVTLIAGNYCTVSLKLPGTYSFSQLKKLCKEPASGATGYFKHIWEKVTSDQ